ncbi:MAG: hypothetical protein AAGD00_08770 [Planctomycetota bacterium]
MNVTAASMALLVATAANAGTLPAFFSAPTKDRWLYPFNATIGFRTSASVFGAVGAEDAGQFVFDQRDGAFLLIYDVTGQFNPADLDGRRVASATLTVETNDSFTFDYDPTLDAWQTWLDPMEDPEAQTDGDIGRPIELFGVGFRTGVTASTYVEGTSMVPGTPFAITLSAPNQRIAYPTDGELLMDQMTPRDVSNNILERFDPNVWAVGTIPTAAPGDIIAGGRQVVFDLDVENPVIQQYLQDGITEGSVALMVTSLQPANFGGGSGGGAFAAFVTKEAFLGNPATLEITLEMDAAVPGDVNGDGETTTADITLVVSNLGAS